MASKYYLIIIYINNFVALFIKKLRKFFMMSKFIVKNKHTCDHYVAIPVSTTGVVLFGLSAYLNADKRLMIQEIFQILQQLY